MVRIWGRPADHLLAYAFNGMKEEDLYPRAIWLESQVVTEFCYRMTALQLKPKCLSIFRPRFFPLITPDDIFESLIGKHHPSWCIHPSINVLNNS
jgi:hypothetical protein